MDDIGETSNFRHCTVDDNCIPVLTRGNHVFPCKAGVVANSVDDDGDDGKLNGNFLLVSFFYTFRANILDYESPHCCSAADPMITLIPLH